MFRPNSPACGVEAAQSAAGARTPLNSSTFMVPMFRGSANERGADRPGPTRTDQDRPGPTRTDPLYFLLARQPDLCSGCCQSLVLQLSDKSEAEFLPAAQGRDSPLQLVQQQNRALLIRSHFLSENFLTSCFMTGFSCNLKC